MTAIIANAPVDLVGRVGEEFLVRHAIPKGGTLTLHEQSAANALFAAFEEAAEPTGGVHAFPGGCGANTAADIATLGGTVQLVAPFGTGTHGDLARSDLERRGVLLTGFATGQPHLPLLTAITPDAERSFALYGEQGHPALAENLKALGDAPVLLLDGHLLDDEPTASVLAAHVTHAMPDSQQLVVCPNGLEIISEARNALESVLEHANHILLSEAEALALTATAWAEEAMEALRARGLAGAITLGARGVLLFDAAHHVHVPAQTVPKDEIVNMNGAGDAFASGYLRGLDLGMDLAAAGALGCETAARVIRLKGARLEPVIN